MPSPLIITTADVTGLSSGNVTFQKAENQVHPSTTAASSISLDSERVKLEYRKTENGRAFAARTNAIARRLLMPPIERISVYNGTVLIMGGTIMQNKKALRTVL